MRLITTIEQKPIMTKEEIREQTIQSLADMMRTTTVQVELKVKKKPAEPAGIKVVIDVTKEQMEAIKDRLKQHYN